MKRALMFTAIAVATLSVQANPTQISNGVMASKEGKTLYTFDKDGCWQEQLQWRLCHGVASVHRCQSGPCRR